MAILSYLDKVNTPLAKEISKNLYVDNILLLAETVEEALEKYKESKQLFAAIGMNLREYVSNSTAVNEQIEDIDKTPAGTIKLLGVEYNTESDAFTVRTELQDRTFLTKRDVVSQINSIYDPMGFAGPLTIRLKCIMREIYNSPIGWKDPIHKEHLDRWTAVCKEIGNVAIAIPRLSVPCQNAQEIPKLWIFSDASQAAIAACAYFQLTQRRAVSKLVCGKTKLTPKKSPQTIPRLELLSILIGVRLASSILEASPCPINELCIVSDSEIALYWLSTTRTLPLFVANQRDRIQKLVSAMKAKGVNVTMYHVESAFNPADVGTRGSTATQILHSSWIQGPQWLNNEEDSWPLKEMGHQSDESCRSRHLLEADPIPLPQSRLSQPCVRSSINANVATVTKDSPSLIDLGRFSRLSRALRAFAYVGKTLKEWVKRTNENRGTIITLRRVTEFTNSSEINAEDIAASEKFLIVETHRNIDVDELQKRYPDKKVFKDDNGIIRYESRLQNADIPLDTKSPMLLPKDSDLCRLVVNHIHKQYAHCGAEQTLSIVRQRFWIPKPSVTISKYVRKCITCKKVNGLPYGAPLMPPLPGDRVAVTKPFQNTACDFLGPFESPNKEKMYVCLYTCLIGLFTWKLLRTCPQEHF
ncbi:hypothetical protein Y032_0034g2857 [Ancylostoma ceylanicum]|uniref:Integrase zinc-binding domain-containing protein n=1 Tax=Ancylostoma ceylanicum TaxID=53326 RepID=A0A016UMX4_9BILA|nr:hypothetical protein Y032_0034g2857 [Ancylostoma ceylanicum]